MKRKGKRMISTMLAVLLGVEIAAGAMPVQNVQATNLDVMQDVIWESEHEYENVLMPDIMRDSQLEEVGNDDMVFSANLAGVISEGEVAVSENATEDVLPSRYSSVDLGLVTKIRNQNPYGNCWAHSAIACMEISMVKEKLASPENLSLSVPHGIYYYFRPVADPLGGTSDEYASQDTRSVYSMLNDGGYASFVGNSALAWQGPVLEEDFFGYDELISDYNSYENADDLRNEAYAYGNKAAIVTEMVTASKPDNDLIKRAILEYGSVGINYNSNQSYYNSKHAAHYCPLFLEVTHAVTVVGWDDNYSKDNFNQKPLENGAWLVKNSAGEAYGESGYFWLSYEDESMLVVSAFKVASSDKYDNNYQYNGVNNRKELIYGRENQKAEIANIFEIQKEKELLKAVQFSIANPGVDYSVQVYKNPIEAGNPLSGESLLIEPITGTEHWSGVYTVDLEQPVWLEQGDKIAVCVTYTPQVSNLSAGIEYDMVAETVQGRSFYRIDGTNWIDCANDNKGNVVIKAFTSDAKDGIAQEHVHDWSQDMSYDGDYHWHICDGAGTCDASCTERGYEKHYGGTATCNSRAICEGCNQEYGIFSNVHIGDTHCEVCGEEISYQDRAKVENPYFELTTLDGETVNTKATGKPKLMILYGAKCGPCVSTMHNLVSDKLPGVDICTLDVNSSEKESVKTLRDTLGDTPEVNKIQFCFNPEKNKCCPFILCKSVYEY